jgi:hypothetical protein
LLRQEFERRTRRQFGQLYRYIEDGTIRAALSREELGPVAADISRLLREASGDELGEPDRVAERTDQMVAKVRSFAEDPTNEPLFARFIEDLATQAQEARASALPLADELSALAKLCASPGAPTNALRVMICQGSLGRLLRQERQRGAAGDESV